MAVLGWGADVADPPPLGEGDHAKHGGGAREVFPVLSTSRDSARPPPPTYGWSPPPCRGGSKAATPKTKSRGLPPHPPPPSILRNTSIPTRPPPHTPSPPTPPPPPPPTTPPSLLLGNPLYRDASRIEPAVAAHWIVSPPIARMKQFWPCAFSWLHRLVASARDARPLTVRR